MRLPRVQFTIRTLLIGVVVVALPLALFRPGPKTEALSDTHAVEIATALVMRGDPSFRPDTHKAKVYQECSMTPLLVDFYSDGGTYVVKRVGFAARGVIRGPSTYTERDQVKSCRNGCGMYLLDPTGKVTGLAPYLFSPDGEVVGVTSIAPLSQPVP